MVNHNECDLFNYNMIIIWIEMKMVMRYDTRKEKIRKRVKSINNCVQSRELRYVLGSMDLNKIYI